MLDVTVNCLACGAQSKRGKKFCGRCGNAVSSAESDASNIPAVRVSNADVVNATSTDSKTDMLNQCPRCGREYPAEVRFCKADGTSLMEGNNERPIPPSTPSNGQRVADSEQPLEVDLEPQIVSTAEPDDHDPVILEELPPTEPTENSDAHFEIASAEGEFDHSSQNEIVYCISCGMAFASGTRFCDQDGTPLGYFDGEFERKQATGFEIANSADDTHYGDRGASQTLINAGIAIALIAVLFGSLYWFGLFDRSGSGSAGVAAGAGASGQTSSAPGLIGTYKSFIADQDIVLTFAGTKPEPLIAARGTIEYYNRINGGTCSASLVPAVGGGVGGVPDNSVRFRQQQIPGKPACPMDIPVTAKIADQLTANGAIVQQIDLEWSDPKSNKVLMRGSLLKEAAK